MANPRHSERLLTDILREGSAADFRTDMLHEMLRLARRHRRFRQARGVFSAVALLAGLGILVRHQFPPVQGPAPWPAKPYLLVQTRPLPAGLVVETKPLPPSRVVASVSTRNTVTTAAASGRVHEINDDELLALAPGPAALIRCGPYCAELVFVSQANRDEPLQY